MSNIVRSSSLAAVLLSMAFMVGCANKSVDNGGSTPMNTEAWWDNPGAIKDHLAAVGSARMIGNESMARNNAEVDARAKLAATLRAEIDQLVENWSKEAGDLLDESTLSSYMNNETITRQFVENTVTGTRVARYRTQGNMVYCLMVLEDPAKWQANLDDSVSDALLRDETIWKTEAMKSQFRDRLDSIKNENQERREQGAQKYEEILKGDGGA